MKPDLGRDLTAFRVYRFLSAPYLFAPVLMVFFGARGLSVTEITLLNSVYCVTVMLFELPTGVLADRWGRRRAMVLGSLLMAVGCAVDWRARGFAGFAVGEGLLALGMTLCSGADSAWLYDALLDAGREHEYRRHEGAATAAKLLGAAAALFAGGWIARYDVTLTYPATAVLCLFGSLAALLLRERRTPTSSMHARSGALRMLATQMAHGTRTVLRVRPLLFAVLFSTGVFTLVRMQTYLYQPYLSAAGFDLAQVGAIMAVLSLAGALGAHRIDALRRLLGERALVLGLPALLTISYFVLGAAVSTWSVLLLALQGLLAGVYSPLSKELLNREIVDSGERATVLSVESMSRRLGFGLFAPLAGRMMDAGGLQAGLYTTAALGFVATFVLGGYLLGRATFARGFEGERAPIPLPDVGSGPDRLD